MANIIEITDLCAAELDVFARLTEAQLRSRIETSKGIFIAESPKVIHLALNAGHSPISLLMEQKHKEMLIEEIVILLKQCNDVSLIDLILRLLKKSM
jgi:hypothetical protein